MTTARPSATQRVRMCFKAGDLKGALRITSGWRASSVVSREQLRDLKLGYECLVRPEFYRSLGRDVDMAVEKAKQTVLAVFFKE